jgi:predicted O-linked N-acetylglucosamine transferase (SPINDLY family)
MLTISGAYTHLNITGLTAVDAPHFVDIAVGIGTDGALRRAKRRELRTKV